MRNFEITIATNEFANNKLDIVLNLRNKLNNSIKLSDFTSNIETLFIIFQCFPKDTKSRKVEEFKTMRRKTKTLELYLVLDYERIMQGTDEENLLHIKEVFLKGCETFLKPLKGFDWEGFEGKVKEVL